MDETLNRGYPYPECDPPLVKDASDIIQLQQQALAIDADMTALETAYADAIIRPDACRMAMTVALTSDQQTILPFFDTFTVDNTDGGAMSDTAAGGIRILQSGWYLVGEWGTVNSTDEPNARTRFLRNGTPVSNFSHSSFRSAGNEGFPSSELALILTAGDLLTIEIRQGAVIGTNRTYNWSIWAVQLMRT